MPASSKNNEEIEPILYLLAAIILFFTVVLIGVEYIFKDDAQVFQVIATLLTGFAGAFMGRVKPAQQGKDGDSPAITVERKAVTDAAGITTETTSTLAKVSPSTQQPPSSEVK